MGFAASWVKYKSLSNSFFQESKFIFLCCKIFSPSAEGSRSKENPPRLPSAVVVKKPTPSAFGSHPSKEGN
jgi:hypothetical protein